MDILMIWFIMFTSTYYGLVMPYWENILVNSWSTPGQVITCRSMIPSGTTWSKVDKFCDIPIYSWRMHEILVTKIALQNFIFNNVITYPGEVFSRNSSCFILPGISSLSKPWYPINVLSSQMRSNPRNQLAVWASPRSASGLAWIT